MAISANTQWDVRTSGSDSNGGGFDATIAGAGTDYSQQNSAQISYTDLVIGSTTTQLTSAANPFTSAHVGNIINITGGTGFTTGRYQVTSVSGSTATMDRAVGTASSSGGTGNLGGSLTTLAIVLAAIVSGNTLNLQAGTYTQTATLNPVSATLTIFGYQTTHGDNGTKPLITTATSSTDLLHAHGGTLSVNNVSFSNTATTRAIAIAAYSSTTLNVTNCVFDGFTDAINGDNVGARYPFNPVLVAACEIKNCSNSGLTIAGTATVVGSYLHGNGTALAATSGNTMQLIHSIVTNNTVGLNAPFVIALSSIIANQSSHGITQASGSALGFALENNVIYGNGGYGVNSASSVSIAPLNRNNAYGSNTSGNRNNFPAGMNDVTLTANPFTNSGSGDYSLNSTTGGGAACKQAGYPGVFPGGASTGYLDIGAVQSSGGGGGSTGGMIVNPGLSGGARG